MLQPTKHTFLVCGEPGSLSTFNIILLWEAFTVYHSLSLIKQCLCDTSSSVSSVASLQISVFGVRSRPSVSVCWAQAAAQCTLITLGLSYRKLVAALSFSQSWVTRYSSQVMSPTACFTWPVTAFPPIRLDNTDTDHGPGHMMSWPESHLETEDGESSVGDRGECTLVHWRLHWTADCTM